MANLFACIVAALLLATVAVNAQSGSGNGTTTPDPSIYYPNQTNWVYPEVSLLSDPCSIFASDYMLYYMCASSISAYTCRCPNCLYSFIHDLATPTYSLGCIADCRVVLTENYYQLDPNVLVYGIVVPCHQQRINIVWVLYFDVGVTFLTQKEREHFASLRAAEKGGSGSGFGAWAIALVACGVAMVALSAFVVVRRRKQAAAAAAEPIYSAL